MRTSTHALLLLVAVTGCGHRDQPRTLESAPSPSVAPSTIIHEPEKLWSIETGKIDALGRPIRAACVTCHSLRKPERLPERPEELKQFHAGLVFDHGSNRCSSCHVVGDQDTLRLADGTTIPNREAMRLCGQCHGPQLRDYQHGAHGGMSGAWDRASGARVRNHCVDCHDPHVPRFQPSTPVLPPHDRHLGPPIVHPEGPAIPKLGGEGGHP